MRRGEREEEEETETARARASGETVDKASVCCDGIGPRSNTFTCKIQFNLSISNTI